MVMASVKTEPCLSVSQIAKVLGYSRTYARKKLAERLKEQKEFEKVCPHGKGKGPNGTLYTVAFVREVFPGRDFDERQATAGSTLPAEVKSTLARHRNLPPSILGVLESRELHPIDFTDLASFLIGAPGELRIRAIAATSIAWAAPFTPIYQAFQRRAKDRLGGPKILLLHPDAKAAKLRSLAEEGTRRFTETSFWENALRAFQFLHEKEKAWNVTVKWVHVAPSSFLIHNSEAGALLEMYDLGRPPSAPGPTTVCIGGRSPVLFIAPGTPYHKTLKDGFDWVFEPPKEVAHCIKPVAVPELDAYFTRTSPPPKSHTRRRQ